MSKETRKGKEFSKGSVEAFEHLRQRLAYDPAMGVIWWLVRPRDHFSTERVWKTFNSRDAGSQAGSFNKRGYLTIRVDGPLLLGHRVAWVLASGLAIPEGMLVDHINGNKSDNRLKNLRLATKAQNGQNAKLRSGSTLPKCVRLDKRSGTFTVEIKVNGKRHYGGSFNTVEDADNAARELRSRLHGEFLNHGDRP